MTEIEELREENETANKQIADFDSLAKELRAREKELQELSDGKQKEIDANQKKMCAICARARNAYSKKQIKEDFLLGIEEIQRQAGGGQEKLVRSESQDGFDLPVYTVSASDFLKLSGKLKKDGAAVAFSNPEDTEIPALQRHVHELTHAKRADHSKKLLASVAVRTHSSLLSLTKKKNPHLSSFFLFSPSSLSPRSKGICRMTARQMGTRGSPFGKPLTRK